jgi:hypothetical protein
VTQKRNDNIQENTPKKTWTEFPLPVQLHQDEPEQVAEKKRIEEYPAP